MYSLVREISKLKAFHTAMFIYVYKCIITHVGDFRSLNLFFCEIIKRNQFNVFVTLTK